ncbi:MAG: flagellar biosynthesis protein FlhF [Gammaproteobacteria bacterium]|nr:flagellar biosynthesis protein FlhF [Gammaproteobacteria bacterium]
MNIKRVVAPDIRSAMKAIKEELGADSVILSTRNVSEGVEVVVAIDYDESEFNKNKIQPNRSESDVSEKNRVLNKIKKFNNPTSLPKSSVKHNEKISWSNDQLDKENKFLSQKMMMEEMRCDIKSLKSLLNGSVGSDKDYLKSPLAEEVFEYFRSLGLKEDIYKESIDEKILNLDFNNNVSRILRHIEADLSVVNDDLVDSGGIFSFVGPTGVGKTTTIAKLAALYTIRNGSDSLALVTIDNVRVGAHDQMSSFARILNIPLYFVENKEELSSTLNKLYDKKLVLIDTAGLSQKDSRLTTQLDIIKDSHPLLKNYLVLSASTQYVTLDDTIRAFKDVSLAGCVITKLDEAILYGDFLSACIKRNLPISYLCSGQKIPEDISVARKNIIMEGLTESGGANKFVYAHKKSIKAHVNV